MSETPKPRMCGGHVTHMVPRSDAKWIDGNMPRDYVPTIWGQKEGNTIHVSTIKEMVERGGIIHFNEDQTEIHLTLPAGVKFSIQFERDQVNAARAVKDEV